MPAHFDLNETNTIFEVVSEMRTGISTSIVTKPNEENGTEWRFLFKQ